MKNYEFPTELNCPECGKEIVNKEFYVHFIKCVKSKSNVGTNILTEEELWRIKEDLDRLRFTIKK